MREKLSLYSRAYLALALNGIKDDASAARVKSLLTDLGSKAVVSATSTHWEEGWTDYWNMNTDIRTTAIVLDTLAQLDPGNSLAPNAVRWLMTSRKADRWDTTQENAWSIIALTDWMAATGELQGNYSWQVLLNSQALGQGSVTPQTVSTSTSLQAGIARLLLDETNGLQIQRTQAAGQTGKGALYYTAYLKSYQPVEKLPAVDRGLSVSREYRLADCVAAGQTTGAGAGEPTQLSADAGKDCPTIDKARVGDVIQVKLNIVVPNSLHYIVVEDPLPAGAEAVDTSLRTTSQTTQGPEVQRVQNTKPGAVKAQWWQNWWWTPTHTEMRDEKIALFANTLQPGSYQFTYQIRASLPGKFLVLPPTGYEMYFTEVWGRGSGSAFTITE